MLCAPVLSKKVKMLRAIAVLCLCASGILAVPIEKAEVDHKDYLLPNNLVIPSHYNVEIDVRDSLVGVPEKFTGIVKITAETTANTNQIILHAAFMNITDIKVNPTNRPTTNLYVNHTLQEDKQFLIVDVSQEIIPKEEFTITITYSAKLHDDMTGFYVSSYTEAKNPSVPQYVLTTQFQPTHARKAFPCFDEPKYKATFKITIKKPAPYDTVISNTPGSKQSNEVVIFEKTNKMSTYLVAFIVSKFNYRQYSANYQYKVWSRPEAVNQTLEASIAMVPIVEQLNRFTGIEYKQYASKLDMVALPDFSAGAMENWGLLTYRETALLHDLFISTEKDRQDIATIIAHELGHQWFGNLVTTEWWDNIWLNEGFATYIEYMIIGRDHPEWEMHIQFVVEQLQSVFEVDSLQKTTPLNRPVYTPEEIISHFGSISYSKGGSVIRMMEHFLGTQVFENGLKAYLSHRNLSSTIPNDLWEDLDVVAKESTDLEYRLDTIMNPWINQRGYPLVTITVDKEYVTFEQKRFFLNPTESKESTEKWYIPISYTTSTDKLFNNTKPKFWLTPQEPKKIMQLNVTDWIIANIQETGYYRVNYNDEYWKKLAEALTSNRILIDTINRAQIVDDIMNLARAGIVEYQMAFDVVDYLAKETEYYPWYSGFRAFRFLLQRYSETSGAGKELKTYIQNLMKELLKNKSLTSFFAPEHIDMLNVVSALEWACNLDVDDCIKDATKLFTGDLDKINQNFRTIVYCTAIRHGGAKEWDKLWQKYVKSNVAAEKVGIINALGCSKNKTTLSEYLLQSINDKNIRSQDASYVFSAVYTSGPEGVNAALDFLQTNSKEIQIKYGGINALDNAVLGLAGRLTESSQKTKLNKILEDDIFVNIKPAAIETTEQNSKWATQYGPSIEAILKKKNSATKSLISQFAMYLSLAFITIYYKRN